MTDDTKRKSIPLKGHLASVRALGSSADGSIIATGSYDATVRLWDPSTGKEIKSLYVESEIGSLAMTPDGARVVIGCKSNFVEVWDVSSGRRLAQMKGHWGFPAFGMDCSKDGRWAASARGRARSGPRAFLWNLEAGRLQQEIMPDSSRGGEGGLAVAFSPDSKKLAIWTDWYQNDHIFIYEIASGKYIAQLEEESARLLPFMRFLDDDIIVLVSDDYETVSFHSVSRVAKLKEYKLPGRPPRRSSPTFAAVSDDGKRVAICEIKDFISEWDIETGAEVIERIPAHKAERGIAAVMYVPGSYIWVSSDYSGEVNLWNAAGFAEVTADSALMVPRDKIRELEDALQQHPNWTRGYYELAFEYWKQGDIVNMFRCFSVVVQRDSSYNDPHKYLKEVYLGLGRSDDYTREHLADRRTDEHANVGGTTLDAELRKVLQQKAREHQSELEAIIRVFSLPSPLPDVVTRQPSVPTESVNVPSPLSRPPTVVARQPSVPDKEKSEKEEQKKWWQFWK